jgi:hypothetical protein
MTIGNFILDSVNDFVNDLLVMYYLLILFSNLCIWMLSTTPEVVVVGLSLPISS